MKDLVVKLKVDGSGVFPAFATLEKKAGQLATGGFGRLKTAIAGAFSVGAVAAYSKSTLDWAGHLTDVATRLGVSTEYIQEMEFALKQSGANMDDLVAFTEKLNRARAAALAGGPKGQQIAETFKTQFGIDETMLKGPVQPIIDAIAKQFESGNVQTLTTALSRMGIKGAGAMTASFADGLSDGRASARKMGAIVSEDVVEQLDIAGDQLSAFAMILRSQFAPAMVSAARAIVESASWVQSKVDWLGGGTSEWSIKDWAENAFLHGMEMPSKWLGASDDEARAASMKLFRALGFKGEEPKRFDTKVADQMEAEVKTKYEELLKGIDANVAARTARRKSSSLGPFDFAPIQPPQQSGRDRAYGSGGDALISVGNFLGHGRSAMQTIAQETNRILGRMDDKLAKLVDRKTGVDDNSLGIAEED